MKNRNLLLKGVAASSGIAIGRVFLIENAYFVPPFREISADLRAAEIERLRKAVEKTRDEINASYNKLNETIGESYAKIADAHILMLNDPMMNAKAEGFIKEGLNAEYAVHKAMEEIMHSFKAVDDEYFRERISDIKDIAKEIIFSLIGKKKARLENINSESVIVAHNLTPSDTIALKDKFICGFATEMGGKTSHTAIVAKSLEMPAVVGLGSIVENVETDDKIIIDGNKGIVILDPDDETIAAYQKTIKEWMSAKEDLKKLKTLPASTLDNHNVEIFGNIDSPSETEALLKYGAVGVGLYRTEFLYFNRSSAPSEQEHFEAYAQALKTMNGLPVVIRTIDLGGDKLCDMGMIKLGAEKNPFMGLRAIRLCLKYPEIFKVQLRAILRASIFGRAKLLYPMISCIEELRKANEILESVKDELRKEGIKFDENIEVGIMVEAPSAAMISDILAKEVDFFSIGTNDLIQYCSAADRVNENVAYLYEPLHPAILRLLKIIIDGAHEAGIKAAMCGEMAGDPYYVPILLGLGLDEFSVSPSQILNIKKVIRAVNMSEMKTFAKEALKCVDADEVSKITDKIKIIER